MKPSLRAILSIAFILSFGFGMMLFGGWIERTYTDGGSALFLSTVLSAIAAIIIWGIWNLKIGLREETRKRQKQSSSNHAGTTLEKRKRDRIDSVLRDLSSEDLQRLKQRLGDGTLDDDVLYDEFVGDDEDVLYREAL